MYINIFHGRISKKQKKRFRIFFEETLYLGGFCAGNLTPRPLEEDIVGKPYCAGPGVFGAFK